jgi:hypothetical protein
MPVNVEKRTLTILWNDRSLPRAYEIAELREMIQANRNAHYQSEVAIRVVEY